MHAAKTHMWQSIKSYHAMSGVIVNFMKTCRCLYIPPSDRSDWNELTRQVVALLRRLVQESSVSTQVLPPSLHF